MFDVKVEAEGNSRKKTCEASLSRSRSAALRTAFIRVAGEVGGGDDVGGDASDSGHPATKS